MDLVIEDIQNAFTPKREIKEPKHFIGRFEEIRSSLNFLNTEGSFLMIYGLRGLGKSSLANQVKIIAEGNDTLLKLCKLDKFIPKKGFNYIVHLIRCDHSVKNITTLVKRIILGDEKNPSLYEYVKNTDVKVDKALKLFADKSDIIEKKVDKSNKIKPIDLSNDIIQIFRQSLSVIRKNNQDKTGVIIIVDEFDIIADKSNFSSLIKSLSDDDFVKFAVVGIADDITDLLEEHASIARQIEPVEIGIMNDNELEQIINVAEKSIRNEIVFTACARKKIIECANGFPYHIHLIGKEALEYAFEHELNEIDEKIVNLCEDRIMTGASNSIHRESYNLICSSSVRELTLKLIAKHKDNHMRVQDLYEELKSFGIEKPSIYLDELTKHNMETDKEKAIIKLVRENKFCRFSDPLFRLYVNLRTPIFEDKIKRKLTVKRNN